MLIPKIYLLNVSKKFDIIIYRQSDYWNIKLGASNHEIYSRYVIISLYHYPVMTESIHDTSSSTSQLITGKSRGLQKSLRYFSGIETSTFKVSTRGFEGCASRCG